MQCVKRTGRLSLQSTPLPGFRLPADSKAGDKRLVTLGSRILQIVQQPTTLGNHRQQPTTSMPTFSIASLIHKAPMAGTCPAMTMCGDGDQLFFSIGQTLFSSGMNASAAGMVATRL